MPLPRHIRLAYFQLSAKYAGLAFGLLVACCLSMRVMAFSGLQYRSSASGFWSETANWACSADGTNWIPASTYPNASDESIRILSSHTITINVTGLTMDQVVVEINASLVLEDNRMISLLNGPGLDLEVMGSFTTHAASGREMVFATGATWSLGPAGFFIKTSSGAAVPYRDNYQGGMGTIPATSTWILRKIGTASPPLLSAPPTRYGNLIFENMTATPWTMIPGSRFNTVSTLIIQGNLDIGGQGSGVVHAISEMERLSGPLEIRGNLFVRSGCSFTNATGSPTDAGRRLLVHGNMELAGDLLMSTNGRGTLECVGGRIQYLRGNGRIQLRNMYLRPAGSQPTTVVLENSRAIELLDSLEVPTAQTITNAGTSNGFGLQIGGQMEVAGTLNMVQPLEAGGGFFFSGSSQQRISGSGTIELYNAVINNLAGVQNLASTGLAGKLQFIQGNLFTQTTPALTLRPGTQVSNAGTGKMVIGPLVRAFDASMVLNPWVFPVGDAIAGYQPATVYPTAIAGPSELCIAYRTAPIIAPTVLGAFLRGVLSTSWWQVDKLSANDFTARIQLPYTNPAPGAWWPLAPGVADRIAIAQFVPASSAWYIAGELESATSISDVNPFRMVADPSTMGDLIYTKPISSFGQLGFGFGKGIILPLRVKSFTLQQQQRGHLLRWELQDAHELRTLELQHSRDGRKFYPLTVPLANGPLGEWLHALPEAGIHFYRLNLTAKNGTQLQSTVLTARPNVSAGDGAFPNPFDHVLRLQLRKMVGNKVHWRLLDASGSVKQSGDLIMQAQGSMIHVKTDLPSGSYHLQVFYQDQIIHHQTLIRLRQ